MKGSLSEDKFIEYCNLIFKTKNDKRTIHSVKKD